MPLAFSMLKLSSVRNGIRSLALRNKRGLKYPYAVLLVDMDILSSKDILEKEVQCKNGLDLIGCEKRLMQKREGNRTEHMSREEGNLTLDLMDVVKIKEEWESLSVRNSNALSIPCSVDMKY